MNKYIISIDFGYVSQITVENYTPSEVYKYTSRVVRIARRGHREAKVVVRDYETGKCILYAFARQSDCEDRWIAIVRNGNVHNV